MYKICRIFALIVFIAASLKFTAHSLNFLRAKYRIDTQKYINPEDNADFVDNKELRKKAKLYRQKMSIHTSIAEQIVSQKLKKMGDKHVLKYDLFHDFARVLSRWPTAYRDISSGVWYKTIYYIYTEGVHKENIFYPEMKSVTPVIIVELKLSGADAPPHTEIHEGNGEKFLNEVIVNRGYEKNGLPNDMFVVVQKDRCSNIAGMINFAEEKFSLSIVGDKNY